MHKKHSKSYTDRNRNKDIRGWDRGGVCLERVDQDILKSFGHLKKSDEGRLTKRI